ncbi:MAG: putative nucleotidyltransferase substrate binding domain-containing protein, partial [Pseudomonadota bacterium]|nr:putative nucleotidyltransferase substrate binding domain-containing protein [Pseudomonadota bacterium]
IEEAGVMPDGRARDLILALEMIGMVRIKNQKTQVEAGEEPNNKVDPETLSEFEKRHLRDAFNIVSRQQEFLKYRYPGKG